VTREHDRCEACGFDGAVYIDSAVRESICLTPPAA